MPKLYEVPRNTWVKAISGEVFKLINIDGMYSYCKDEFGNVCHYAAYMEVEIIKEH